MPTDKIDSKFYLLPKLKDGSSISFSEFGTWKSDSQTELANLAKGIYIQGNEDIDITSIPDIWARPIVFENILLGDASVKYNECSELIKKYRNEWRAILAILALRQISNFAKIGLEVVTIPKNTDSSPKFLQVLANSIPEEYKRIAADDPEVREDSGSAYRVYIITNEGNPLAICWPNILVCPAVDLQNYYNPVTNRIAWWKPSGFDNPIGYLSGDEKAALYKWLSDILDTGAINNNLASLIKEFREELNLAPSDIDKSLIRYKAKSLGITGIFKILGEPIQGKGSSSAQDFLKSSDVLLMKQKQDTDKELLIIARDIERQWNKRSSDIIVGGYITASAVPHATGILDDHTKIGNNVDLAQYNTEIHMVDEFFTDKLAIIGLGINVFPSTINNCFFQNNGESFSIIPPIKRELLNYLTADYVAKNMSFEILDEGIEVTLTLPVTGPDKTGIALFAKKLYRKSLDNNSDSDIVQYKRLPVIEVWPNFRFKESGWWNAYYTFYDSLGVSNTFYAVPVWDEDNERLTTDEYGKNAEIRRGKQFPEAIQCFEKSKNIVGEEILIEIGLLLLNPPKEEHRENANQDCKIGIDFGTTNTIAYMQINDEYVPMKFQDRLYDVITSFENSENKQVGISPIGLSILRKYFIADSAQPSGNNKSIKTIFHRYDGEFDVDLYQPLAIGNIYYMDNSKNITEDVDIMSKAHTDDMKWGKDSDEKSKQNMSAFLGQLCMQCMAEAVYAGANQIEWFFSYPTSFSPGKIGEYRKNWCGPMFERLKSLSDVTLKKPEGETESVSVAKFFTSNMDASTNTGIVCLDIGGGSTDIAIWQGDDDESLLQHQTSLLFAGRNIIDEYLWEKKKKGVDILGKLRTNKKDLNALLEALSKNGKENVFKIQLEALLNFYGKTILSELSMKNSNPEIATFIRDISFALSGMFYYVGYLVGYLRKIESYTEVDSLPTCFVGGNGSKLLDWASGGQFDSEAEYCVNDVFKACFIAGMAQNIPEDEIIDDYSFAVLQSEYPKEEVAYGLICNSDIKNPRPKKAEPIISGEIFQVEGQESEHASITIDDIKNGVQIDRKDPKIFMNFLNTFNHEMSDLEADTIQIHERDFVKICRDTNQYLVDLKKDALKNPDKVKPESIFILLLKKTYEWLSTQGK